jgi:hypothetical protein
MRAQWVKWGARAMVGASALGLCAPGQAFLFWNKQAVSSQPAQGGEAGITLPLPGANAKEQMANLIWTMRAGLNVAALQCQFAPSLRTVTLYNNLLRQHSAELQTTYATLQGYFKRVGGKRWANEMDQYTTKTYNGFSTLHAQLSFCETAASIGRETLDRPRGELGVIATARMRDFRSSLVPRGDQFYAINASGMQVVGPRDLDICYDKRGRPMKKCS